MHLKLLADNYMEYQLPNLELVKIVIRMNFGWMMLIVKEVKILFKLALILNGDNIIVIQELNAFI